MAVKLTRREREKLQRRREILAAAQELFSRRGFERTSMAQIAARAEFAVGTLYKFFKDKRALYRALILDTVQEFERALTTALKAPGTEVEKLDRYIATKAELFFRHLPTARLYFAQTTGARYVPMAGIDREVRAIYESVLTAMEAIFRSGIRKGVFLKADPRMLVLGLEGVSNAFLDELIEHPDDFSPEILADLTRTIFFERLRLKARTVRGPQPATKKR